MKTNYTPGPWYVIDDSNRHYRTGEQVGFYTIANMPNHCRGKIWIGEAKCYGIDGFPDKEAGEANARLMAAAPEMFEALMMAVKTQQADYDREVEAVERHNNTDGVGIHFDYASYPQTPIWLAHAKRAIAKATGEKESVI
jgi:hypothetical protein